MTDIKDQYLYSIIENDEEKYRVEIEQHESGIYTADIYPPGHAMPHVLSASTEFDACEAAKLWVEWHRDKPEKKVFEL